MCVPSCDVTSGMWWSFRAIVIERRRRPAAPSAYAGPHLDARAEQLAELRAAGDLDEGGLVAELDAERRAAHRVGGRDARRDVLLGVDGQDGTSWRLSHPSPAGSESS